MPETIVSQGESFTRPSASSRPLRRSEAADHISAKHFPCSPKTLAKLAVVGGSPPFRKVGRIPLYAVSDLDEWAIAKIGPRVSSTSELREMTSHQTM